MGQKCSLHSFSAGYLLLIGQLKAQDVLDTHSLVSSRLPHSFFPEHSMRRYKQGSLAHLSAALAEKYKAAFLKFYNEL